MSREIKFQFVFQHPETKQVIKSPYFTIEDLINDDERITIEEIRERSLVCDCRPVGETNVVECNCDDYYDKFELIAKRQATGLKDKNARDILEGDIILHQTATAEFIGAYHNVVEYYSGGSLCGFRMKNGKFTKALRKNNILGDTVVGNIYENPELLISKPTTP